MAFAARISDFTTTEPVLFSHTQPVSSPLLPAISDDAVEPSIANRSKEPNSNDYIIEQVESGPGITNDHMPGRLREWAPEFSAWLVGLLCFGSITSLLIIYDNRLLHEWQYPITLNTLVAIVATIGTACLGVTISSALGQTKWIRFLNRNRPLVQFRAIEGASRGVAGSVLLLVNHHGGTMAILGAILTILLLAVSPFVQQVIRYDYELIRIGDASIATTTAYGEIGDPFFVTDSTMEAAVYVALFSPPTASFSLKPDCSTGNCTWPLYQTLAFCASCADISHLLVAGISPWVPFNVAIVLPNGFGITYEYADAGGLAVTYGFNITTSAPPIAFKDAGSVIVDVQAVLELPTNSSSPLVAFECVMQICVNTYDTRMINFELQEAVAESYINSSKYVPPDGVNDGTYLTPPPGSQNYAFQGNAISNIQELMQTLLNGEENTYEFNPIGPALVDLLYTQLTENTTDEASPTTQFFSIWENLATSMTTGLRGEEAVAAQTNITGDTFRDEVVIRVTWLWMIFPLALLVLVIGFLCIVVVDTRRKHMQVWKSDVFASMAHGVGDSTRQLLAAAEDVAEAEAEVDKVHVRLNRDLGHWRLVDEGNEARIVS